MIYIRMKPNLEELQNRIGYHFKDEGLLLNALTHSSYANERQMKRFSDNERLEFLGDAVLEAVSSEFLYEHYPDLTEGELSRLRASIVCEPTLARCCREFDFGHFLRLGRGEERTGGRQRDSITSDALEAMIGAMYLDAGLDAARSFILRFILTDIEHKKLYHDCKTALQEIIQARSKEKLYYTLVEESGPDHQKTFKVEVCLGEKVLGEGSGGTKKGAEQEAAYAALVSMHKEDAGKVLPLSRDIDSDKG